ncbi:MAG: hypothetical protein K9K38_11855 [Rhodoferax sp.]|nr:hypothetical protein [Rhodoferax sp.]
MKKLLALAFAACTLAPALAQTSVGVSIGINQPGVYGRIDIGNFPQPRLVQPQPVVIVHPREAARQPPVYLYVPPGHQKKWAKHCGRYKACGQQVYFVQEDWVRERYEEHRGQQGNGDHDQKQGRGHDKRGRGNHGGGGKD